MQPEKDDRDPRKSALDQWVGEQTGEAVRGVPASVDASFRRYFRYSLGQASLVAMDAPPPREDCRPFVDVARRLADAGVNVPRIRASDLPRGYLLLDDLGTDTWLRTLNDSNADAWFGQAIDTVVRMQVHANADGLPVYDEALLRRELTLFPEWYLQHERSLIPTGEQQERLHRVFDLLVASALEQPRVFVHRDYMPRNLMVTEPNPGVIDFQDAVLGPISYDPICLFKDAFISWPEPRVLDWLRLYHQRGLAAGLPLPEFDVFLRWCDLMGAQRHLKVIGIFARILHRDGKPGYVKDVPRFFTYLRSVIGRRPELADLGRLLDEWECP